MQQKINSTIARKVEDFLGEENIRWFKHIKGLKGRVDAVLKLNFEKKRIPAHPIHLREGMQIRNFMRTLPECNDWTFDDFEKGWVAVLDILIDRLNISNEGDGISTL